MKKRKIFRKLSVWAAGILTVVLLCLLPRWVLCFLVAALALGCGALVMMKR